LQTDSSLFLIGVGIGIAIAIIGGLVDYWLGKRNRNPDDSRNLPGCMLYLAGILGLAGVIAIVVSLIFTGGIGPAIVLGAGILGGFYAGFAILIFLYLLVQRFWPNAPR
jgi:purine-cytosine permease-like protein